MRRAVRRLRRLVRQKRVLDWQEDLFTACAVAELPLISGALNFTLQQNDEQRWLLRSRTHDIPRSVYFATAKDARIHADIEARHALYEALARYDRYVDLED